MTPTAWDIRNNLIAVLNAAQRSGKPYVDIALGDLDKDLKASGKPGDASVVYRDIMTRMMRPGDTVLKDTQDGDKAMLIRYVFDANHELA